MFTDGLSVVTLYSVPARTLVSPLAVNSLPLRLRTTGGPEGARVPLIRPPPGAMAKTGGGGGGPPPRPKPPNPIAPPPPPTFMRPISPLHTTAFQVGLASQDLSASIPVTFTM